MVTNFVSRRRRTLPRRACAAAPVLLLSTLVLQVAASAPAAADSTATGPEGQTLTVSKVTGISPAGETVTVRGSGFDERKGIYVAYCVDTGPDVPPSPCGGGADTTGSLGASHWISSNPPSYGEGLAVPYGDGGSFTVTINLTARINDDVDCTARTCAVVTRADHTRSADRSQDVRIPVTIATESTSDEEREPRTSDGEAGGPAAGPDQSAQAGEPAGTPGVITAGTAPPAATTPYAEAAQLERVSASSAATRWWLGSAALAGLALAATLIARGWARRRRNAG